MEHSLHPQNGLATLSEIHTTHGTLHLPQYFPGMKIDNSDLTKNLLPKYKFWFNTLMINISDLLSSRFSKIILNNKIHQLLEYDGIIFSDGGGYSKCSVDYTQKDIIEAQIMIDVDIASTLDYPILLRKTWHRRSRISKSVENALEAKKLAKNSKFLLYASVHGRSCTEIISVVRYLEKRGGFDGYAVGSLIPIFSNFRFVINLLIRLRQIIPNKPLHVYGLTGFGLFLLLFYMGVDSVDSHGYLLAGARRYYFILGKNTTRFHHLIKNKQLPCTCPICKNSTPKEIDDRTSLTFHNYWVLKNEVSIAREMIQKECYRDYLEERLEFFPIYLKELDYIDRKMANIL